MRIDYKKASPGVLQAMFGLGRHLQQSGLPERLLHLIELRVSQINGCAYCVDMHAKDARAEGETQARLDLVPVWREAPVFTPRERAALEWAETLTRVADGGVPDDLVHSAREHFTDRELADLTLAVIAINGWNRLNVAFQPEVGTYQPAPRERAANGS